MNWKITEKTTSRNGIQTREEWRDGEYISWRKHFTVSETERVLVVSGVPTIYSKRIVKVYEDFTTDPAYPMQSGFAEIIDVKPSKRAGFVRISYRDWAGVSHEVEACIKSKQTRKAKVV